MLQISEADFLIDTHPREKSELERHALVLFEEYERLLNLSIRLDDYAIEFDLENGSLSGRGKVWVALGSFYAFVCGYGAFSSGIEAMASHAKAVGEYLSDKAPELIGERTSKTIRHHSSAAQLGELEKLFKRVRQGKLEPRVAAIEAMRLLEQTGETMPEGMDEMIERSFSNLKLDPVQYPISFEGEESLPSHLINKPIPKKPKPNRLPPAIIDSNRLRVEIRREGKGKEKQITIVELPQRPRKHP